MRLRKNVALLLKNLLIWINEKKKRVKYLSGKYWQSAIDAQILIVCVCLCTHVIVSCRLSHINKAAYLRGQSYQGYNLRAVSKKKSSACVWAAQCLLCVCVSWSFTKTLLYLLAPCSLHNIIIMHCDSCTPGPCARSRAISTEDISADSSLSTPPPFSICPRIAALH